MDLQNFTIGKKQTNVLSLAGNPVEGGGAQIFIECRECRDTIALIPKHEILDRNKVVDEVSDQDATNFFNQQGWSVHPQAGGTLCPECRKAN